MSTTVDPFTRGVLLSTTTRERFINSFTLSYTKALFSFTQTCRQIPYQPLKPSGLVFRPLVLPLVNHVIDRLLRDNHGLDARRRPAVDGSMQDRLPNLQLRHAVVDGAARVQAQLQPGLLADDQTQSCRRVVAVSKIHI